MRKALLATSALVAALAFTSAASAQNVSTQNNQRNNATVGTRLTVSGVAVGGNLTGSAVAIGNLYEVSATTGQGIGEVASNNGAGTGSPQINFGAISSELTVVATQGAGNNSLSSTAAANVINLDAVTATNYGNRVVGQTNNAPVSATTTLSSGANQLGNLTVRTNALGNSMNYEGSSSVQLGAGQNGGGLVTQINNGPQTAYTNFGSGMDARVVTSSTAAVGNSVSATAPTVGLSVDQTNNANQFATVDFAGGFQQASVSTSAIGNIVTPTGAFSSASGVDQVNNASQGATTNINSGATFNGGRLTASAAAIGNAISVEGSSVTLVGSQINNANQTSVLNANGGSWTGGADLSSQSIGNLITADMTGAVNSSMPQTNFGMVSATTNVFGGAFGASMSANSLAAGNILQVESLSSVEGINGAANQINNGSISSFTNVTGGSFVGNLTAGATSVGNLTSVSIR